MKLEKIKLSGFKSFVDPTTMILSSHLTGIVGPNGCGKSNIIDAIRWVMGESSAKQLRGEQISDVIFGGSVHRKPIGQASVELIFDNSDGLLGGEFANYVQIAIRRQVDREGQSVYSLNGTRCRRRDIMDIFWNTGLVPRGYSIIEQGMISKLVECKPEELRVYLESVAGISKYKERRRETENRIHATNENLLRISDLKQEIDKQLKHLKQQARAAKRYKELTQEERQKKAQLLACNWQQLNDTLQVSDQQLMQKENQLLSYQTTLQHLETALEKEKEHYYQAHDTFNQTQQNYYEIGADIARIEQSIKFYQKRHQQTQSDLLVIDSDFQMIEKSLQEDQKEQETLSLQLEVLEPQFQQALSILEELQIHVSTAEQDIQIWNAKWATFLEDFSENSKDLQFKQTHFNHLKQQEEHLSQSLSRAYLERERYIQEDTNSKVSHLKEAMTEAKMLVETSQEKLKEVQAYIDKNIEKEAELQLQLIELNKDLHQQQEQRITLKTLQDAAFDQAQEKTKSFLSKYQLDQKNRFVKQLKVESGWEQAVEVVLEDYLDAICIEDFEGLSGPLSEFQEGRLTLMLIKSHHQKTNQRLKNYALLREKVKTDTNFLDHVYIAKSLEQALKDRKLLNNQETFVTQDGVWVGSCWIKVNRYVDQKSGIIKREKTLEQLNQKITILSKDVAETEGLLQKHRAELEKLKATQKQQQTETVLAQDRYRELHTQYQLEAQRVSQNQNQLKRLLEEIQQRESEKKEIIETYQTLQQTLEKLTQIAKTNEEQREVLQRNKEKLQKQLKESKEAYQKEQKSCHQAELDILTIKSQVLNLKESIEKAERQKKILLERRSHLEAQLETKEDPSEDLNHELETNLKQRLETEKQLEKAKQALNQIEFAIKTLESKKQKEQLSIETTRQELETQRLSLQEAKTRQKTIEENLLQHGYELEQILDQLSDDENLHQLEEQLSRIELRIKRLGPVNLAAISEYDQLLERHTYLETQTHDLEEALETLQSAIRKIDRQTRVQFKNTFDKVNEYFIELFPKVFDGGKAYLELTSEDLLETGVRIMAKPPGKYIHHIQLMSGGEKALVGITLIFALFQFNPSPFCMLDEVDAPLDDVNVIRFCELVKEMSKKVQFIFISHNKVTIEMANHLMGVTMHEPGVSRIVAVDIDQAVKMANEES